MDALQQIGAIVGLASFVGLAILTFLYFAQARHVRDLEEKATYLPEDLDLPRETAAAAEGTAEQAVPQQAGRGAQPELQAARQVQMAQAAAERRKRFDQRRRPGSPSRPGASGRRMPEPRAMIVIVAGVAVLAVGVVFGAGRIFGGDESSSGSSSTPAAAGAALPEDIKVAVLNGTATPGLAASFAQQIRNTFNLGSVGNTETAFESSAVMFAPGQDAPANTVAGQLGITDVRPMSSDVKKVAEDAPVAFIVGEDRAGQQ
jgi:hypothetical protein